MTKNEKIEITDDEVNFARLNYLKHKYPHHHPKLWKDLHDQTKDFWRDWYTTDKELKDPQFRAKPLDKVEEKSDDGEG